MSRSEIRIHWPRMVQPSRDGYDAIALVSAPRHLDALATEPGAVLVACSEWLVFQLARERGLDAVHLEGVCGGWPEDSLGPSGEVYLRGCAWINQDGADVTRYRGVSLGRLYGSLLALSWQAAALMDEGLRRLCRLGRPRRLILFDLSAHFGALGPAAKRRLAAEAAAEAGCVLDDRLDPPSGDDPALQHRGGSFHPRPAGPPGWKDRTRAALARLVEEVFSVRITATAPRVFLYVSLLSLRAMTSAFCRKDLVPLLPFNASPKDKDFLGACWRHGLLPVAMPQPPNRDRAGKVEAMAAALRARWQDQPVQGLEAVHREAVAELLLGPGTLEHLAGMVDQLAHVLDRHRVAHIVSGDVSSPVGRALCELAAARGIGADETLNGVFAAPLKDPTRCGDGVIPAAATRQLSLGPATEAWLAAIGSPMESVVVGYPALGTVDSAALASPHLDRALVLPGYAWLNDPAALRADTVPMVVATLRALAKAGLREIRLRIHPGTDNAAFYRAVINHFQLPVEVSASGSFASQVDWADLVVGPAGSSAFLETLAAGKPYYVTRPLPSAISDDMLPGAVIADDPEALVRALKAGDVPDRRRLLNYWCAADRIADPARAIWQAIAEAVTPGGSA